MTKGKLGLTSLKNEANNIVANEEARKFVQGANSANSSDKKSVETQVSNTPSNRSKKSTSSKTKNKKPAKKQPNLHYS